MTRRDLQKIIKEEYENVMLEEGLFSWASGVADDIVYGILNKRADIMSTKIFDDPKLLKLAKDLKWDKAQLQSRIGHLLTKDNKFLKALATQRYKR